jgi:hypothetical protein
VKNVFAPQNRPITHDQPVDGIDFFYPEKEAGQPQLIPGFPEALDGFDQHSKSLLRKMVQMEDNCIQIIPQGIEEGKGVLVKSRPVNSLVNVPGEFTLPGLEIVPVRPVCPFGWLAR